MNIPEPQQPGTIELKPSAIFAFIKIIPLIALSLCFLYLSYWLLPAFIIPSLLIIIIACYRFLYTRNILYHITPEVIRIHTGIFFKSMTNLEMYRVKDYTITQSLVMQLFKLMTLTLKTTDPENRMVVFRGIPVSDIVDIIRDHVQQARLNNRIYELN